MEIPTYMEEDGHQQHQQDHDQGQHHQAIEDEILDDEDEEHLEHVGAAGNTTTDQSQGDGEEQYSIMDSNDLEIMYQQQQQSGEIGKYCLQNVIDYFCFE